MMKSIIETYNDNIKQLEVEKMQCDKCKAKYVKVRRKQRGSLSFINLKSNIPYESCECTVCSNHRYDVEDIEKDIKILDKILQDTINNNSQTQLRAENKEEQINNLWRKIYDIGKYGYNKFNQYQFIVSKYAIQCNHCGYIKLTDNTDIEEIKSMVCNRCKAKLVIDTIDKYNKIMISMTEDIEKCKRYMEAQSKKENEDTKETVVNIKEKKESSGFTRMKQAFKKHNPNMDILEAYTENDGLQKSIICCDICGTNATVSSHSIKKLKNYKCQGCIAQQTNPNYLGLYKRDLTHTTKNGLVCRGQKGDRVELQCKYCKTIYKDKSKVRFLRGQIFCNKMDTCSSVEVFCPECFYGMTLKNIDIVNAKEGQITCPKCDEDLLNEANNTIASNDASVEINEGLRYLGNKTKKPVTYNNEGIGRTREPLYRGRDGMDYYNCRCVIHNQSCILSEAEIELTCHKYCNNVNNIFILEDNIKKLKLNREASFEERSIDKKVKK